MKKRMTGVLCVVGVWFLLGQIAWGKTIYVDAGAAGANNGTSWANAYVYLQDALTEAAANDEIRVAAGVYTPDMGAGYTPGDRSASFVLKNLVKIYGGYPAGGGTTRDWEANQTILSGDLNGDDNPGTLVQDLLTDATRVENSYHVIYSNLCGLPTLLDGLIITGGQANGTGALGNGGGWYNITNSSPTITNCTFTRNAAQTRGGAWYNEGVSCKPTLTGVTFTMNYCADRGGAIAMLNTGAEAKLDGCQFSQNRAGIYGGSVYFDCSSPTIANCSFTNEESANGGSLAGDNISSPFIYDTMFHNNFATTNGGAIWLNNTNADVVNCIFVNNSASKGGAFFLTGGTNKLNNCELNNNTASNGGAIYSISASPEITQCVFNANDSASQGGAIYSYGGHPKLFGSKFFGNHALQFGGAILNQAACEGPFDSSQLTGWNCLFVGNYTTSSTSSGGAVANLFGPGLIYRYVCTTIINSTFCGNMVANKGGGFYTDQSKSTNNLKNCILYGNADTAGSNYSETAQIYGGTNTVQYNCIQGLSAYAGNGNIGNDPLFVNPLGEDWIGGTLDDNLRLQGNSPCIDAGDNASVPAEVTTDLDGNPRFFDIGAVPDNGSGTAPIVDMGAFERYQEGPFECGDYFHPYPEFDFNQDCTVNLPDFALFCEQWLTSTAP